MIAIVLGFRETGSSAPFSVLYAGRSAADARAIADAPPAGIIRTESLANPVTHHNRYFPEALASPDEPEAPAEEPHKRTKK